jgi:hypothetical protein
LKPLEQKKGGGSFGNILEAYYQEITIRKRRFGFAGSPIKKLPTHLLNEGYFTI